MRDLQDDAHAVARLTCGIFARAMFQLFHDAKRVAHAIVSFSAVYVHHGTNAASVVFKRGVI